MNGSQIGSLVTVLPQFVGRQVIDRTGLTGIYDLTLKWMPEAIPSVLGLPRSRYRPRIPMRRTSSPRCRSSSG